MPPEAVNTLTNAIQTILTKPDAKERFLTSGVQIQWQSPQELGDFVKAELVKYTAMIKEAGMNRNDADGLETQGAVCTLDARGGRPACRRIHRARPAARPTSRSGPSRDPG